MVPESMLKNIAQLIDPSGRYFHGRILSRSDCPAGLKQKELRRLFPCGVSMVAVLDDREDVWLNSLDNLIKIEPYKFLERRRRNKQQDRQQHIESTNARHQK